MLARNSVHLGDCLSIMESIDDQSIDMILCDLPYGTTDCKWDVVIPFAPLWAHYSRVIKPNGAIVLTASQPFTSAVVCSNPALFRYELIWQKEQATNFMFMSKQFGKIHENVLVFYKKQPVYNPEMVYVGKKSCSGTVNRIDSHDLPNGGKPKRSGSLTRYPTSIIQFNRDRTRLHPTQKPVKLFEYLIKTYTCPSDLVLDNCAGSGTTGVACVNTGRDYILIEKEPEHYNGILERLASVR